jgi:hypothetical protein
MNACYRALSRCRTWIGQFRDSLLDGVLVLVFLVILLSAPAFAGSGTYTHDVLRRLITATYGTGVATTYSCDAVGNRTSYMPGERLDRFAPCLSY